MPSLLQSLGEFSLPSGSFASFSVAVPADPTCLPVPSMCGHPHWRLKTAFLPFQYCQRKCLVPNCHCVTNQLLVTSGTQYKLHLRSKASQPLANPGCSSNQPPAFSEPMSHQPRLFHQRPVPRGGDHLMTLKPPNELHRCLLNDKRDRCCWDHPPDHRAGSEQRLGGVPQPQA